MHKSPEDFIDGVDELLATPQQIQIRNLVGSLPEDLPSLAWRSQLNSRLALVAPPQQQRSAWHRFWSPALGLGLAGVLAVVLVTPRPVVGPVEASSIEASLAQLHEQSAWGLEVATDQVPPTRAGKVWTESDIDLL
jgi:hypothetical protein